MNDTNTEDPMTQPPLVAKLLPPESSQQRRGQLARLPPNAVAAERAHEAAIHKLFEDGLKCSTDVAVGETVRPIFFGIYPFSVTVLIGGSGTGKSSLLYNIALAIANNEPFLNIQPGLGRPGRVLYVDPENAGPQNGKFGGVRALRLERIGKPKTKDLVFHDWRNLDLADPAVLKEFAVYLKDEAIDVCILDPLANVYGTSNENDNSEAARQMKALVNLAREIGVAVVLCHHSGKNHESENGSAGETGRGASARFAAADVALHLRPAAGKDEDDEHSRRGDRSPDTVIRVRESKNRWEPKSSIYIRMAGNDRFVPSTRAEWRNRQDAPKGPDKAAGARQAVRDLLADNRAHSRKGILAALSSSGFGRPTVEEVLGEMEAEGAVKKCRQEGSTGFLYHSSAVSGEQAVWGHIVGDLPASLPDDL